MRSAGGPSVNDPATVAREYASEERFLARRLAGQAQLFGGLVEDVAIEVMVASAPTRVLDVGCGTGDYTARVRAALGAELVAVDLSTRMVELARAQGLDARVADIQDLPFAEAEFDCVLANRVLYHLADLDRGLAQISRVLRPGGALVAITYSEAHLAELYEAVGRYPAPSPFSAENGGEQLSRRFEPVDRHDIAGTARFPTAANIVALLEAHEEFGYFSGIDVPGRLREVTFPFDATYRHALFVAHKPGPHRGGQVAAR